MIKVVLAFTLFTCFSFAAQNEKAMEIKEIDDNVYVHTSYHTIDGYGLVDSNGLIVIDGHQAYIIDTPWSEKDTDALLKWAQEQGYTPVVSVSTHWHEDRTAGIELLNRRGIPTYTSERTQKHLAEHNMPLPTHTFKSDTYALANGQIELYYPGPGHTDDNIVVWLASQNILFGGCLVRSLNWKSMGNLADASVNDWAKTISNVQSRFPGVQTIVPGHGEIGNPDMLAHTIYLADKTMKKLGKAKSKKDVD